MDKKELLVKLYEVIRDADWSIIISGTCNQYHSDLGVDDFYLEDADDVLEDVFKLFRDAIMGGVFDGDVLDRMISGENEKELRVKFCDDCEYVCQKDNCDQRE